MPKHSMVSIADRYGGAFLCDGVGLGKTYVGMMLIERFVKKERRNVVLIVPASARISVWETTIKKYIPEILEGFYPFKIINHTDLLLDKNQNLMEQIASQGEIVVIDEAHHFRNRSSNRYRKLFDMMAQGRQKQMFMLTATPINNSFLDLQHLIELFTHRQDDYFAAAPLGIHSLAGHFKKMEAKLGAATGGAVTDTVDATDDIFRADQLVLAEGLNLQDASCLINYELHWNPVRLMQGHPHHRLERADQGRGMAGGVGAALQPGVGAVRTQPAHRPPQL